MVLVRRCLLNIFYISKTHFTAHFVKWLVCPGIHNPFCGVPPGIPEQTAWRSLCQHPSLRFFLVLYKLLCSHTFPPWGLDLLNASNSLSRPTGILALCWTLGIPTCGDQRSYLLLRNQDFFCFSASVAFVLVSRYLSLFKKELDSFLLAGHWISLLSLLPSPVCWGVCTVSLPVTETNASAWSQRISSSIPAVPLPQQAPCHRHSSGEESSSQQGTAPPRFGSNEMATRWPGPWHLL